MNMNFTNRYSMSVAMLLSLSALGTGVACSDSTTEPVVPPAVQALTASLAPYASFALAKQSGYATAITDCMSNGDQGAMGVHYANTALLDAVADPLKPEALIYEPGTNGEMSLVGVEFIVPYAAVPKSAQAPVLFGQAFTQNDTFGVWGLHVWTTRSNPSGLFAPWNPR
ncbi:MAG: hypothetical protein ABI969_19485, partial [bacterium]